MATLGTLHSFVPATAAKSTEVNANFNIIKTFIEGISTGENIDGGAITTTKLGTGAATEDKIGPAAVSITKLASGVLNMFTPIGSIVQYAGSTEPTGWKLCNGQALSISSYTELYNLLTDSGSVFRFGANPSGSTFLLPNLKGRLPVGFDSTQTEFDAIGETGGAKVIAEGNLPAHSHAAGTLATASAGDHYHSTDWANDPFNHFSSLSGGGGLPTVGGTTSTAGAHTHSITGSTTTTGSGNVFLPPYIVVNYLIKVA
jgi:microcystin-dependent protein